MKERSETLKVQTPVVNHLKAALADKLILGDTIIDQQIAFFPPKWRSFSGLQRPPRGFRALFGHAQERIDIRL